LRARVLENHLTFRGQNLCPRFVSFHSLLNYQRTTQSAHRGTPSCVMRLKLQLHQRNYISGAERRIIQPYPIVGITHDNKKAHYRALPWHTSYRAILWHLITGVNAIYRWQKRIL